MYEHLNTWTFNPAQDPGFRLDLWDTGRTRDGKSELRYALAIIPEHGRVAIFEGEDFWPSPLAAIDSDETAAALLSFLGHDGEVLAFGSDESRKEIGSRYNAIQREALETHYETLNLWQFELEEGAEA